MTSDGSGVDPPALPPRGTDRPARGPQPLRLQGLVNRLVRGLLRAPPTARLVGKWLVTLYVVGRRSGKIYPVPMTYLEHQGALLLGSGFAWGRNLRTGDTIDVRFRGRRRVADVRVLTDEPSVMEHYAIIARHNPRFADFNRIGFDDDGSPRTDDLRAAWAAGARVFLLTLR